MPLTRRQVLSSTSWYVMRWSRPGSLPSHRMHVWSPRPSLMFLSRQL